MNTIDQSEKPFYISQTQLNQFTQELESLKAEIKSKLGIEDYKHLRKMELWGKFFSILGYATAWIPYNFFAAFFISTGNFARWTMITHHVTHRGYDRLTGIPKRYHSKYFAQGWRRYIDWFDWLLPEAWDYEHNFQHHYRTGELADPDLVEHNLDFLRKSKLNPISKYFILLFFSLTWKFTYYTPSTLLEIQRKRIREEKAKNPGYPEEAELKKVSEILDLFLPISKYAVEVWVRCVLPYMIIRFGLIPLIFLPLGYDAWFWVMVQSLLAEALTNFHSFIIITPNHAGADLYRFENKYVGKGEFYLRQIIGSANYNTGNEISNFFQGYLNYQIEHHLWPDLPMLKYKEYQPRVKALCEKYGVPYVQESVWTRLFKMVKISTGQESMKRLELGHSNLISNTLQL